MPAFEYQALDQRGRSKKGILEADSERHARQLLREQKLLPTAVQASHRQTGNKATKTQGGRKPGHRELALFTRQLATLIQSGIPVEESLQATARQTRHKGLQSIALQLRAKVREGHSLAHALADFPQVFKPVYRALVASGEKSGDLGLVLEQLASYTEESQNLRNTLQQALVYPAALMVFAIAVIALLMGFVVPKVVSQFEDMGQTLPWITRALIHISDAVVTGWPYAIVAVILAALFWRWWMQSPARRLRWHRSMLRIPLVGNLLWIVDSARLLQTLGILLSSGVPLVEALKVATETLSNSQLQKELQAVTQEVTEGRSFSHSLQQADCLPALAGYMIASGERSGELPDMVKRAAATLERDLDSQVQMFLGLIEPAVIVLMGIQVMAIVLAILMPIVQLNTFVG